MKRIMTVPLLVTCSLLLVGCQADTEPTSAPYVPYHFAYPDYDTVEDANAAALVIVEGTVLSSQAITPAPVADPDTGVVKMETLAPDEAPYVATVYNFKVDGVRKGSTVVSPGTTIKFTQAGGVYNGVEYGTEEMAPLPVGPVKMVLLLAGSSRSNLTLLNPTQGAYSYSTGPQSTQVAAVDAAQPPGTPEDVVVASDVRELG